MNYNFLRVFISGARTVPADPKKFPQIVNQKYIKKNLPITKIKNISFYKKYETNFNEAIVSGVDNIYDAKYTGYLFEQYSGEINIVDKGYTDEKGVFKSQGLNTGTWVNPKTTSDEFGTTIYPVYPPTPEGLYLEKSSNIFYPKDLDTVFGAKTGERYGGKILQGPMAYVDKTYYGIYEGFLVLKDVFYDEANQTVSFYKTLPYLVTGEQQPTYKLTTISLDATGTGFAAIPGSYILNNALSKGSGLAFGSGNYLVEGYVPSYRLRRGGISGFGKITGYITGKVLELNSGKFVFNGIRTGTTSEAYKFVIASGLNASGILRYRNPIENDSIIIENELDSIYSSITYSTLPDFKAPQYFNSIIELNNIFNENSGRFHITSEIINLSSYGFSDESGLKLVYNKIGNIGNSTSISSFGTNSPILLNSENLTGGISYYEKITPTGIYYGNLVLKLNPTGEFVRLYDENVYGKMIKNVGFKTFTGAWRIFGTNDGTIYNNIKDFNSLETGKIYSKTTEELTLPENLYTLKLLYFNDSKSTDTDVAELKIFRNNIQKTGIILKGNYL